MTTPYTTSTRNEEPIQMSGGGMIFNQRADRNSLKSPEKASRENENSEQELESAKKSSNVTENESKSSWPSFADEDYIGFCFRDDGGIDLEEIIVAAAADQGSRRDRGPPTRRNQKGEEKGSTDLSADDDDDDDDVKEITEVEETTKWKSVPESSRGSTRSNSSSGSFAFPVMNWEWKSSPQRMPQLEEQLKVRVPDSEEQPRKEPRRFSRFHCCRF